jgi:hypothetical protein
MNVKRTAKNIQVGDMLALRHDMQFNADGVSWFKDPDGEFVADLTSELMPVFHGWIRYVATYKKIIDKTVTKQGNRKVTILACDDGTSYELNATYAYIVKESR